MRIKSISIMSLGTWMIGMLFTQSAFGDTNSRTDAGQLVRPYDVPKLIVETGLTTSHQSIGGVDQTIWSLPLSITRNISDRLDLRLETSISGAHAIGPEIHSVVFGPGLTYWINREFTVSPFLRFGAEDANDGTVETTVYGAEILLQYSKLIAGAEGRSSSLPASDQRFFVHDLKLGSISRDVRFPTSSTTTQINSLSYAISYDTRFSRFDAGSGHYFRIRPTIRFEAFDGDGTALDRLFSLGLSLRRTETSTGKNAGSVEFVYSNDAEDFERFSLSFLRQF